MSEESLCDVPDARLEEPGSRSGPTSLPNEFDRSLIELVTESLKQQREITNLLAQIVAHNSDLLAVVLGKHEEQLEEPEFGLDGKRLR